MNRFNNPINASITTDGFVLRVDKDDFKIFVGGVLINPVRVQHS